MRSSKKERISPGLDAERLCLEFIILISAEADVVRIKEINSVLISMQYLIVCYFSGKSVAGNGSVESWNIWIL